MDIVGLIIQLVMGAVGGNVAGALLKNFSLVTAGNSIAGIIGGGLGGQIRGAAGRRQRCGRRRRGRREHAGKLSPGEESAVPS